LQGSEVALPGRRLEQAQGLGSLTVAQLIEVPQRWDLAVE
jgi:hypothetical protein